jgi:hypothetical protein
MFIILFWINVVVVVYEVPKEMNTSSRSDVCPYAEKMEGICA